MDKFKKNYIKIANQTEDITTTHDDFYFNLRLAMLTTKTTKNTIPESQIKLLIHNIWIVFLKDCENPKIGVTKSINKVFDKYK